VRIPTLILALALPLQAVADDRVPMSEDPQLERGLRIVAKAHFMRKYCRDRLSLRYFRAFGLMNSLKARARELGYNEDEMEAYFDDKAQKSRVEGLAMAELVASGADAERPDSFCEVAEVAIAADRDFGRYFTIR